MESKQEYDSTYHLHNTTLSEVLRSLNTKPSLTSLHFTLTHQYIAPQVSELDSAHVIQRFNQNFKQATANRDAHSKAVPNISTPSSLSSSSAEHPPNSSSSIKSSPRWPVTATSQVVPRQVEVWQGSKPKSGPRNEQQKEQTGELDAKFYEVTVDDLHAKTQVITNTNLNSYSNATSSAAASLVPSETTRIRVRLPLRTCVEGMFFTRSIFILHINHCCYKRHNL